MALYNEKTRQAVVQRAMMAVQARQAGKHSCKIGSQTFDLDKGGYCNRFIRQCFETTLGLAAKDWRFGAGTARETLDKLEPYRIEAKASKLQPGDIIGWYDGSGPYGHIALYVGDYYGDGRKLVAENTSAKRGFPNAPGTKITQLRNMRAGWSAYRVFPTVSGEASGMADAEVKRHDTKHLDRHNDYIAVYEVPEGMDIIGFTDGGEAIEDLLDRVPDTATPHQVAAVIGRAMVVVEENCCELWPDWSIHLRAAAARIFIGSRAVEQIAQAYLAVDRIDVEEVLAGGPESGT